MVSSEVKCGVFTTLGIAVAIVAITLMALSFQRVDEGEQAIRLDDVSNTLHDKVYTPGLHTVLPDSKLFKYPAQLVNMDLNMVCRASDGLEIELSVTFQYTYIGIELAESFLNLGKEEKNKEYLKSNAIAAIYETCSFFPGLDFTEQRAVVEFNMSKAVEKAMKPERANTHTTIGQFQLTNFNYPNDFQNAVNSKQQVQQQINIKISERQQILTSATTELLQAQQAVEIQINDANAEATRLVTEAQLDAQTEIARWNEFIEQLDAEKTTLGLTFEELVVYKEKTLIGDAPKAVVNVGA